jgi:hypothetical protein
MNHAISAMGIPKLNFCQSSASSPAAAIPLRVAAGGSTRGGQVVVMPIGNFHPFAQQRAKQTIGIEAAGIERRIPAMIALRGRAGPRRSVRPAAERCHPAHPD